MQLEYWGIQYRLTYGDDKVIRPNSAAEVLVVDSTPPPENDLAVSADAIIVDNLTDPRGFNFEYEAKTGLSVDGVSSDNYLVALYNLSEEEISVLSKSEAVVQVELGWKSLDMLKLEFYGNVFDIQTSQDGADTTYNIIAYPSGNVLHSTMLNDAIETTQNTTTLTDVFKHIARKLGIGFTSPHLSKLNNIKKERWYLKGASHDVIKWLCEKYALVWTISNGKLIVADGLYKAKTNTQTKYTLTENSIKYIRNARQKKFGSNDVADKLHEIDVGVFYDNYELGDLIDVDMDTNKGTYIVVAKRVIAQSKGNGWDVVINMVEVDL